MARSPSRSPTRLPSPLPFSDSSEKRKWHEKEEYYQYYYSSQQQPSNPRGFEQSRHVPARLHKTPPPLKEIKDHSPGSSRDGNAVSRQSDNAQPASRAKVIATVLFYLVAALVMVRMSFPIDKVEGSMLMLRRAGHGEQMGTQQRPSSALLLAGTARHSCRPSAYQCHLR